MGNPQQSRLAQYLESTRQGSGVFWSYLKRWFIVATLVGLLVGLVVTAFERAVVAMWSFLLPMVNPVTVVVFPTVGLILSGLALQYLTVNPDVQGTEEYITAYHERGGRVIFRSFPGKVLAAFATLGFGGSAGLEGPSIYMGSALGSYLLRRLRRFGFTGEDVRQLMVAGAAAGVSAIFKAPLTGIVFALEVPYRDDLSRQALVPSLVSSVTAYLVLVQFLGVKPLFDVAEKFTLRGQDLLYSILLGLIVGLAARLFSVSFHTFRGIVVRQKMPLWAKTGLGGLVTGLFGLVSLQVFAAPLALGTGYEGVAALLGGQLDPLKALALLVLKAGATLATLASGAAGGIFIPMIVLGASLGTLLGELLPGAGGPLFTVVGMSAFLAAGYSAPLSAAVFVAETTGGTGYIIPGLVAAAVAYTVSGRISISDEQRWRRESTVDRLMSVNIRDVMTRDVVTVGADESIEDFVSRHLVRHRHKSLPVVDGAGRLVGMVGLTDVRSVSREAWGRTPLREVVSRDVLTTVPSAHVGEIVGAMTERDIDRVPVVASDDPGRIVGIVSSTDLLDLERIVDSKHG